MIGGWGAIITAVGCQHRQVLRYWFLGDGDWISEGDGFLPVRGGFVAFCLCGYFGGFSGLGKVGKASHVYCT